MSNHKPNCFINADPEFGICNCGAEDYERERRELTESRAKTDSVINNLCAFIGVRSEFWARDVVDLLDAVGRGDEAAGGDAIYALIRHVGERGDEARRLLAEESRQLAETCAELRAVRERAEKAEAEYTRVIGERDTLRDEQRERAEKAEAALAVAARREQWICDEAVKKTEALESQVAALRRVIAEHTYISEAVRRVALGGK